jgi:ferredoxin
MTHIITSLCLRDSGCVDVCPVECIIPGKPVEQWPWFYIDPDTCIDCGACIPECPYEAIFTEEEVPSAYTPKKEGERQSMPVGTSGFTEAFEAHSKSGTPEPIPATRVLAMGETVDLKPDIKPNYDYFKTGPGYKALEK